MKKLLCFLGIHGPNVFGNESVPRSSRMAPFIRVCTHCGQVWEGREVTTRHERILGDWRKRK
jgi:hypothetical protein